MPRGNPNPKPGPGRPKGCPNKNTTYVRDMISYFLEKRVDLIDELFLKVAKDSPADALRVMLGMFEYVIPKMARHEQTGIDGAPIAVAAVDASKLDSDTLAKILAASARS